MIFRNRRSSRERLYTITLENLDNYGRNAAAASFNKTKKTLFFYFQRLLRYSKYVKRKRDGDASGEKFRAELKVIHGLAKAGASCERNEAIILAPLAQI